MMLIFESTKSNTSTPQTGPRPYFEISTPHVRTVRNHGNDDHRNKRRWHTSIFKQQPTQISCETKRNQRYSPIKKKPHNLELLVELFPLLEFCPPLWYLHGSCLIVTLLFNVLFLRYFPLFFNLPSLSIYSRSANISALALFSLSVQDTPLYCWLAASGQKPFSKIT